MLLLLRCFFFAGSLLQLDALLIAVSCDAMLSSIISPSLLLAWSSLALLAALVLPISILHDFSNWSYMILKMHGES